MNKIIHLEILGFFKWDLRKNSVYNEYHPNESEKLNEKDLFINE